MPKKPQVPSWVKLDNAAKIYPAAKSRTWSAVFRLSMTLSKPIDLAILRTALKQTLRRIPIFSYKLSTGLFWAYLDKNEQEITLYPDTSNPCVWTQQRGDDRFLFRVRVYGQRVALETSHVLSDGHGAMRFLATLVACYLQMKEGISISKNAYVLDLKQNPGPAEWQDDFVKNARKAVRSRKEEAAYHIKGSPLPPGTVGLICAQIPIDALKEAAKGHRCTVNTFLAAVLFEALLAIQKRDRQLSLPIKLSIPVNLRKYYRSQTLRNFASYFNVPIWAKYGEYTLEDIIRQIKAHTELETLEPLINARMSTNVAAENNPILRLVPLFIKNAMLKMMYNLTGERYFTLSMSNLGLIDLPADMQPHVKRIDFVPGPSKQNKLSISVVGYQKHLTINFVRQIEETEVEKEFLTRLVKLRIPVLIESNRR